ncbi:hypothetical protein LPB140_09965 [Sphingorhabdus lutea]|uniref:NAD(P)-binding domain-containing protein n=1 Tax=Sphingorhabdus lutea TaxID=1913578 RepID=A0A1L3JF77_9SPHN|nr:complex I NDUFA9 subunit family protein [Sphingorhabdus lutea]APG63774.1 hypothetical protein LPB140_09965 [Sphingorhabdus lutea]
MENKLVTIFGGNGFLGHYVAQAFLKKGARVRIASRNPKSSYNIKPLGNLGQTQFVQCDILNVDQVARAMMNCDIAINLVGVFGNEMAAVNGEGAANIAAIAAQQNIASLVHISAIGADIESPAKYGRSKAAGEQAVLKNYPNAAIIRPSIIFATEDNFINRFAKLISLFPVMPIFGAATKFQPIFAGDLANVICAASVNNDFSGQILDAGGPDILSMSELNHWIAQETGRNPLFVDVPAPIGKAFAIATGWLPFAPINHDQYKMLQSDNIVRADKDAVSLAGITPMPMRSLVDGWLDLYRQHGRFSGLKRA